MSESEAFVKFSERFVHLYRVSSNEALTERLRKRMENPESFRTFHEVVRRMLAEPEVSRLPQSVQSALDQPEKFPIFAEAFVQFFVKMTGDESLPQDLEVIAKQGRELFARIRNTGDTADLERILASNEDNLRRQAEQNRHLISQDFQEIMEAELKEDIDEFAQHYGKTVQEMRETQKDIKEFNRYMRETYREWGEPIPPEIQEEAELEEDITEDPTVTKYYESLVRETAAYERNTIELSVSAIDSLLKEYRSRKRERNLYRLGFVILSVVVAIIGFLVAKMLDQWLTGVAALILGVVVFVTLDFVVKPWFDRRKLEQRRDNLESSLQEFYPTSVRTRFHLASLEKISTKYPSPSPGETSLGGAS